MVEPKHFFFDMDGTLTPSRGEISEEMAVAVMDLEDKKKDIVIVSGARYSQMQEQLNGIPDFPALSQNGNEAYAEYKKVIWRNRFDWMQKLAVFAWIEAVFDTEAIDRADLVEDRGCQISFSLIGHHMPKDQKNAFDPDGFKRAKLLQEKPFTSPDIQHGIGGTTCIDFYRFNKGQNIKTYIDLMNWKPEDCLYVGDQLYAGGNDQTVIGVIPTLQVSSPEDCLAFIRKML